MYVLVHNKLLMTFYFKRRSLGYKITPAYRFLLSISSSELDILRGSGMQVRVCLVIGYGTYKVGVVNCRLGHCKPRLSV